MRYAVACGGSTKETRKNVIMNPNTFRSLWFLHLWVIMVMEQIYSVNAINNSGECMPLPYRKIPWVRRDGTLFRNLENSLDLSMKSDALDHLKSYLSHNDAPLKILSLATCEFFGVPSIFTIITKNLTTLSKTLERVSFFENRFNMTSEQNITNSTDNNNTISGEYTTWWMGLLETEIPSLLELDLRNCAINYLPSRVFSKMPSLERLDLSGNHIYQSAHEAFFGLSNLRHLDIIDNTVFVIKKVIGLLEGIQFTDKSFEPLVNLKTLDLSYTKISQTNISIFKYLAPSLEMLSLCSSRIPSLAISAFNNTQLIYLDLSNNIEIFNSGRDRTFKGIEDSLEVLLVRKTGLFNMSTFVDLTKLKIISLADNNIQSITRKEIKNMTELVMLDLSGNRISTWNSKVFVEQNQLRYLSLVHNNINLITDTLLSDIRKIQFVGFWGNSLVCNCLLRILIESSISNAESSTIGSSELTDDNNAITADGISHFQTSDMHENDWDYMLFMNYFSGSLLTLNTAKMRHNIIEIPYNISIRNYTFQLFDFTDDGYKCITSDTIGWKLYYMIKPCSVIERSEDYDEILERGQYYIYVIIAVSCTLLPLIGLLTWKWWYIRYFLILIKNTALLSVLEKKNQYSESDSIYNYDAFVSYCNEDRDWVLGELLPHIEQKENVNICLHERDFEVGVTILENIISCMDRSKAIVLVISQQFLLSHWCQFEMHLAQHRLIETKREHLILILLEEIPRRKRPNTLHYLMMTKTYIVWPTKSKDKNLEIQIFWKRLKKSLLELKPGTETDSRV